MSKPEARGGRTRDGALRPQDQVDFETSNQPAAFSIYRCAAEARAVRPYFPPERLLILPMLYDL